MARAQHYSSLIDFRDIAHWITLHLVQDRSVPTREQMQTRYGMSRATAYRWEAWARAKQEQIDASESYYADLH